MIGTGEGSSVVLSPVLTLGYPFESANTRYDLIGTLLDAPLWLLFGSDVIWEVVISCTGTSGDFITSKIISV